MKGAGERDQEKGVPHPRASVALVDVSENVVAWPDPPENLR